MLIMLGSSVHVVMMLELGGVFTGNTGWLTVMMLCAFDS